MKSRLCSDIRNVETPNGPTDWILERVTSYNFSVVYLIFLSKYYFIYRPTDNSPHLYVGRNSIYLRKRVESRSLVYVKHEMYES